MNTNHQKIVDHAANGEGEQLYVIVIDELRKRLGDVADQLTIAAEDRQRDQRKLVSGWDTDTVWINEKLSFHGMSGATCDLIDAVKNIEEAVKRLQN